MQRLDESTELKVFFKYSEMEKKLSQRQRLSGKIGFSAISKLPHGTFNN